MQCGHAEALRSLVVLGVKEIVTAWSVIGSIAVALFPMRLDCLRNVEGICLRLATHDFDALDAIRPELPRVGNLAR